MTIFYINNNKTKNQEFLDKYDFAKFIEGNSNTPEETKQRIKIAVTQEKSL